MVMGSANQGRPAPLRTRRSRPLAFREWLFGLSDGRRSLVLIVVMGLVAVIVCGIAMERLYHAAIAQEKARLAEMVELQKSFIESLNEREIGLTSLQIVDLLMDTYGRYRWASDAGEFVIGLEVKDAIALVVMVNSEGTGFPRSLDPSSPNAELLRRALTGQSGTMIGLDHDGTRVLAAYTQARVGMGSAARTFAVVAKHDMAHVKMPFIAAARTTALIALVVVLMGAWAVVKLNGPLIRRLQASEARNRSILESAAEAIITTGEDGRIVSFNRAAEQIFGIRAEAAVGRPIASLIGDCDAPGGTAFGAPLICGAADPCGEACERQGVRADGSRFPIEYQCSDIHVDGDYLVTTIIRDMTEQREAERMQREMAGELERRVIKRTAQLSQAKSLLEAEKAEQSALIARLEEAQSQLLQSEKLASIGQLAAGVAHEINNPVGYVNANINTLTGYMENLFKVIDAYREADAVIGTDAEMAERVKRACKEADLDYLRDDVGDLIRESMEGITRVRQIVRDLKEFSHMDRGGWEWADLHKGLDSTLNIVHNEIKYKAVVNKEYGELPQVECLPSQLNQVFMNLLVNAAHAIDEKGIITVRTGTEGPFAWVEVADTGKGIDPDHLQKLFDPFFTTKPVGEGTGLGLSLSYGIVQNHHGHIDVDSAPGRGTTFRVRIPINQPDGEPTEAAG